MKCCGVAFVLFNNRKSQQLCLQVFSRSMSLYWNPRFLRGVFSSNSTTLNPSDVCCLAVVVVAAAFFFKPTLNKAAVAFLWRCKKYEHHSLLC